MRSYLSKMRTFLQTNNMKLKIFETKYPLTNSKELESQINDWLDLEKPKIVQVLQTDSRNSNIGTTVKHNFLTITFLYE